MGYARYDTPLGDAGYAVEDVCHEDGCDVGIDRGLWHLCGGSPGRTDEWGCGRWFCGEHLYMPPTGRRLYGQVIVDGLCRRCLNTLAVDDE